MTEYLGLVEYVNKSLNMKQTKITTQISFQLDAFGVSRFIFGQSYIGSTQVSMNLTNDGTNAQQSSL